MTERERWIVYPLLFLAISISLKDKFTPPPKTLKVDRLEAEQIKTSLLLGARASINELHAPLIHTYQIQVEDLQSNPKIVLRSFTPSNTDQDPNQKTVGGIDLFGTESQILVGLGGNVGGGYVVTRPTDDPKDFVAFGYDQRGSGLFWLDKQGQPKGFFRPRKETPPQTQPTGTVENDSVENDTVENDSVENDTVENDTVENDTVENGSDE